MSNYSFMKSGLSNEKHKNDIDLSTIEFENIEILLSLFVTNALKNSAKYVEISGRNGITKEDIKYSLRYEVFEFLNRPNLVENIKEATIEYNKYSEENNDEETEEELHNMIIPDEELDSFKRAPENTEFIKKIHGYYDNWTEWNPPDTIGLILKNAIDKIDS